MDLNICIPIFVAFAFSFAHAQCPGGWTSLAGECFLFGTNGTTWTNAESSCLAQGGSLLKVKNHNVKTAITKELSKRPVSFWWTGLHKSDRLQCKHNWRWNNEQNSDLSQVTWDAEPNNYNGVEHCVEVLKAGLANDENCASRRGYICKYVPSGTEACPHEWVRGGPYCYYISTRSDTTKTDWNTARTICQLTPGADLMWIDAPAEASWLQDVVTKLWSIRGAGGSRGWWIGANNLPDGDKNQWKWNDQQQSTNDPTLFLDWDVNPTVDPNAEEHCGIIAHGLFYDGECYNGQRYICQATGPNCPNGWESAMGQCFYFEPTKWVPWDEARRQCKQYIDSADLVTINSPQILAFVNQKLKEKGLGWMWTGLNDRDQSDRCSPYLWTDGTSAGTGTVTWATEPNSHGGLEHCGEILRNGVFNDAGCKYKKAYACKAPLSAKRKRRQTQCPNGWQFAAGRCFNFVKERLKMADAQTQCRGMGADLLNVPSAQVKAGIENLLQTNKGAWWTGLKIDDNPICIPNWRWLDEFASDTKYVSWESEPNNLKGVEHCGEIWKNGVFNDARCYSKRGYICKYEKTPGTPTCVGDFVENEGSCYYFSTRNRENRKTWDDARADCKSRQTGADLVWITSRDEYLYLRNGVTALAMILSTLSTGWWTGLNNGPTDNAINWKWLDQTMLADTSYITWDSEPNNYNGMALCSSMRGSATSIRSRNCNTKMAYICHIPSTTNCPANYQYDPASKGCYYIEPSTKVTWLEARVLCQAQGAGDLLTIRDAATK
ncbi:unnamed protein product, partial [Owenia fusiformis]